MNDRLASYSASPRMPALALPPGACDTRVHVFGPGARFAYAPANASDDRLRALRGQEFRGVRFNFSKHLGAGTPIAEVVAMTPRLAEPGLHLQVHFDSSRIDELVPHLAHSAVPVVFDQ